MIITHRGHHNNLPENTLEAFDAALNAGADAVECDLRLTLDNQVVVCHDNNLSINDKRFKVSKTNLKHLTNLKSVLKRHSGLSRISQHLEQKRFWSRLAPQNDEQEAVRKLLTIDELFDYIKQKRVPFFLEVKNRSPILVEEIAKRIKQRNLWSQVHIIGFSFVIGTAVRLQSKYPRLRVMQLINIPPYSYIRKPAKSYGVFLGWYDEFYGSEWLFKRLIPISRLIKLREFYEKNGFKVMAGVINKKQGFEYFKKAGIEDIVTDNIDEAFRYFKKEISF